MNIYFLFMWRLQRLEDYKFLEIWENRYLRHMKQILSGLIILYLILTIGTGIALGEVNFVTGLMGMILVGMVLGYYMVVHFIGFIAVENERYFRIKMGQQENTINYDNVVG
jgi:uncharacterized membrane protein